MCSARRRLDMTATRYGRYGLGALLVLAACANAQAQDGARPKSAASQSESGGDSEVARFCGNFAPTASEARLALQTKRLVELGAQINAQIADLEKKEAEARGWLAKRDALLKAASEDVAAIYAKMSAESAASQLGSMDDMVAAAILAKLNPRAASTILSEMDAARAARLTSLISGAATEDKS
jgi:flagellar motility protein MotE (MotC chaperone)